MSSNLGHGLWPELHHTLSEVPSSPTFCRLPGLTAIANFPLKRKKKKLKFPSGSETSGFVAPGYVNLNLWFSKDRYTFGAQVQNNTNNWSDRVFRAAIGAKISPEFFVKAAMDNQNSQEFFLKYKMCPSATLGLALQMQNQPAEGFKGYLDYPFNFGLTLKLDQ